jgi:hypothetical protein
MHNIKFLMRNYFYYRNSEKNRVHNPFPPLIYCTLYKKQYPPPSTIYITLSTSISWGINTYMYVICMLDDDDVYLDKLHTRGVKKNYPLHVEC